jgi:excinuclease ABC subunit C
MKRIDLELHIIETKGVKGTNSSIESIPGIEKTIALIQHFKSVKRLKLATKKEISDVIGASKPKKLSTLQDGN